MRFYKNLPDDLHCFQAALLMALSEFFPDKEFSYTYIDKVTGFKKDQYTQDTKGLLWLAKQGFEFVRISDFDEERFIREGEKYLKWYWRPDIYERNQATTDFSQMRDLSRSLAAYTSFIVRLPKAGDIDRLLEDGYLVMAHINPHALNPRFADIVHSVVITRSTKHYFFFNNPGLPPCENQRASKKKFQAALYEVIGIRRTRTI